MRKFLVILLVMTFIIATGCAPQDQGNGQLDYEQTKKMVVDILKTDEGKKAIEEIMTDDKMKQQLVIEQKVVTDAIEQLFSSEKGGEFWKKQFEDPKFAEAFAKSMQKEHEKLIKQLMKDPEYQGMLQDIFKDPEMQKEMIDVFKSKDYRSHLQEVINETMESPIFQAKIQDLLIKAAEEMQKGEKKKEEGKDEGGE
ncbi:spore gernimation protein GerD [Bacillus sp. HMF5848]|uniref:spore germination lipoprotein GerD n=1 Tax=Bacillus sp. HMF5848 TaxID=2495421 RepID=UPI000F78DF4E|nr:spore germination lipoprotein GerD [Bacillus sp. HMF5848]RSK25586.1 spore gernimation protein GerD [Bacillus sp. HMF5848]